MRMPTSSVITLTFGTSSHTLRAKIAIIFETSKEKAQKVLQAKTLEEYLAEVLVPAQSLFYSRAEPQRTQRFRRVYVLSVEWSHQSFVLYG